MARWKNDRYGRKHIPLSIKRRIWVMPCVICGTVGLTCVDHIIPCRQGGSSDESNLQPLCVQCNAKKKHLRTNDELREWFESRKEVHLLQHEYRLATRYMNFYDSPSFDQWLAQRANHAE